MTLNIWKIVVLLTFITVIKVILGLYQMCRTHGNYKEQTVIAASS